MTATALPATVPHAPSRALATGYWLLRVAAALCFIGHGAFGLVTKAAWVPYFGVVGIPESWAWRLMPVVGAVDVLAAVAVLVAPRTLPLLYMVAWATWTALLRPLAGEPVWEALERAGNYGVPLALVVLTGLPRGWRGWRDPWRELWRARPADAIAPEAIPLAATVLRWSTGLLLLGHGALGAISRTALLTTHYAAVGLPAATTPVVGWLEVALALAILARPAPPLLYAAAAWKLATESLWIASGAPAWEFVERAGSYAAPLALAALLAWQRTARARR